MKKKKLLVVLGAGASVEQGMSSVKCLNAAVKKWAKEFTDLMNSSGKDRCLDFYGLLEENRKTYNSGLTDLTFDWRTEPNFERVMGDLHLLMNAVLARPGGDPLIRFITGVAPELAPDGETLNRDQSRKVFYAVGDQLANLYRRLAETIRIRSADFEAEIRTEEGRKRFAACRDLLGGLSDAFDVGVYNLNYDTVALNAQPDAFTGFERGEAEGKFHAREVYERTGWNFVYHLHGSVHHWVARGDKVTTHADHGPKIVWREDITDWPSVWSDIRNFDTRSDNKRMLVTSLVAGGWKLDQLQREPFLTFYSNLPRHAYTADAILIAGYGFGDSHVNSVLKNALREKAITGNRPPVLVLDYDDLQRPFGKRNPDSWTAGLNESLRVSNYCFRADAHRTLRHWTDLPETLPEGAFEKHLDQATPVAIWTGGFCSAAQHRQPIAEWLGGNWNAL